MAKNEYEYDFFILHYEEDLERAIEMLKALEEDGRKGYLDERDGEFGKTLLTNLSTAINNSKYVILLISKTGITNSWWERKAHISIQHRLDSGAIVPVILPGMTEELIPECLNMLEHMLEPVFYEGNNFLTKLKSIFTNDTPV